MNYLPHTEEDIQAMLNVIGVASIEELFNDIPQNVKLEDMLPLPPGVNEQEVWKLVTQLAEKNRPAGKQRLFLGAGAYYHYIPKAVFEVLGRTEFYTAYTPYQPEVSQGTLQAIFEYQTMVSQVIGTEIANASMYDGATAVMEAALMARRINKKKQRIVVSKGVHPHYIDVLMTYLGGQDLEFVDIDQAVGVTNPSEVLNKIDDNTVAVIVQNPNFFGNIEDIKAIADKLPEDVILIGTFTEALAFGIIEPPGHLGAKIVAGEGQSLGLPLGFGGPYLGVFGSIAKWAKYMPGRLIGQTTDNRGNRVYVMTLAAREQHIRRARATSNICTNVGLDALAAAVYLSLVGKNGFVKLSLYNHYLAQSLKSMIRNQVPEVSIRFDKTPTFNEFVIHLPVEASKVISKMRNQGIIAGLDLGRYFKDMKNDLLVCTTEMLTTEDLRNFVEVLKKAIK